MVLPSKKVISLFLACGIAIGSITFAALYSRHNSQTKDTNLVASQTAAIQNKILEQDSDNDGLKDWEESLWKTNPKVADTDGDKTNDGEEVRLNRNPAVAGPNDSLSVASETKVAGVASSTPNENTLTTKFGQELMTRYMNLKQQGKEVTDDDQAKIISELLASYQGVGDISKTYTTKDIIVTPDTPESVKAYGNAVANVMTKNSVVAREKDIYINELFLVKTAVDTQDPQYIKKIPAIITSYKNIITDLGKINVPYSMAIPHLNMMNNFSKAVTADNLLLGMFTDPAASVFGLQEYLAAADGIMTAMNDMQPVFTKYNVQYTQSEPGFSITLGRN